MCTNIALFVLVFIKYCSQIVLRVTTCIWYKVCVEDGPLNAILIGVCVRAIIKGLASLSSIE